MSLMVRGPRVLYLLAALCLLSACAVIPGDTKYPGPPPRPQNVLDYYDYSAVQPYTAVSEQVVTEKPKYVHKRLIIGSEHGSITIEHYKRRQPTKNLVFIFPVLGGKLQVEGYFAKYFAQRGFDTAIVHRDKDFKRPELFSAIEEVFRKNVIRDRIAMDYFQREEGIEKFGSFGISRGAINAAITAGVDSRMKYNVLALGGSDLVGMMKKSSVGGVDRYRNGVLKAQNITVKQFYETLAKTLKTDPRFLAKYMDARDTLMFLSIFDDAVPFKYGMRLRRNIGHPKTVFLTSGHYTALLYTQFVPLFPPSETICIFPMSFVESESLQFYNNAFDTKQVDFWHLPIRLLQLPVELLGKLYYALF